MRVRLGKNNPRQIRLSGARKPGAPSELLSPMPCPSGVEWIARLTRLQDALAACPTDIFARSELATLLEALRQPEEALHNWKAVLTCAPHSLQAREGIARCRRRMGHPLQSNL